MIKEMMIKVRDQYIEDAKDELKLTDDAEEIEMHERAIRNLETMNESDFDLIEIRIFEVFEAIMDDD